MDLLFKSNTIQHIQFQKVLNTATSVLSLKLITVIKVNSVKKIKLCWELANFSRIKE